MLSLGCRGSALLLRLAASGEIRFARRASGVFCADRCASLVDSSLLFADEEIFRPVEVVWVATGVLILLEEFFFLCLSFTGPITLVANRAVAEFPGGDLDGGPRAAMASPAEAGAPLAIELDAERDVSLRHGCASQICSIPCSYCPSRPGISLNGDAGHDIRA